VCSKQPTLLALFTGAIRRDELHDCFDWSFRQVYTDEQQPAFARQVRFRKPRSDKRESHTKLADRLAVTSRRLRVRGFAGLGRSVNQRNRAGQVCVIAWATPAIAHLFGLL